MADRVTIHINLVTGTKVFVKCENCGTRNHIGYNKHTDKVPLKTARCWKCGYTTWIITYIRELKQDNENVTT